MALIPGNESPWIEVASFTNIDLERFAILATKVFGACRATIFTTKNRSHAYLLLEDKIKDIVWANIDETARSCRISIAEDAKARIPEYMATGGTIGGTKAALLIAAGLAPRDGENSKIQWHIDEPGLTSAGKELEDGRVDYRERQRFVSVRKDQHVLTVVPPSKGAPGRDVFGNAIPARDGVWVRPRTGEGLRWNEQQQLNLYADMEGTIQLIDNAYQVRRILSLHDIDFRSGNIDYDGDVDATGTLTAGFSIVATGAVSVVQGVEGGRIRAKNIVVHGPTSGETELIAQGRIQLERVEGASVRCDGRVSISGDAINIKVFCGQKFEMTDGTFAGGLINALGGAQVGWLGGKDGSATQVKIDIESCRLPCLDETYASIERVSESQLQLKGKLGVLADEPSRINTFPPDKRAALKKLLDMYEGMAFELDVHRSTLRKFLAPYRSQPAPSVFASRGISQGVRVAIGSFSWDASERIEGACKITFSRDGTSLACQRM